MSTPSADSSIPYILGLDLGANSVGWALLKQGPDGEPDGLLVPPPKQGEHPSLGVRVFAAGVDNFGDGSREETKNAKRRQMRLQRRQLRRRAQRVQRVYDLLLEHGLFRSHDGIGQGLKDARQRRDALLKQWDAVRARELAEQATDGLERRAIRGKLPYYLRARALNSDVSKEDLGRVFLHLAQRRGFKSNRKLVTDDDADERSVVKKGISELEQRMAAADCRTLGEYFWCLDSTKERIRQRWTSRKMYEDEFDLIVATQKPHHRVLRDPRFVKRLRRALFYQRPLRSQKNLIGVCDLESGAEYIHPVTGEIYKTTPRRRAPLPFLEVQEFRLLQKVNDLRVRETPHGLERDLTPEERRVLHGSLQDSVSMTFAKVRKLLGLPRSARFNLERGGEKKLLGNQTRAALLDVFGSRWDTFSQAEKEAIVLELWEHDDPGRLERRIAERKGVWADVPTSHLEAKALVKIIMKPDYASLSRAAIRKLLPSMREGKHYAEAVAGAYGKREVRDAEDLLRPVAKILGDLRNPVVSRVLTELRRVVNALIKRHGKPSLIRVELARDLKRSRKEREKLSKQMRTREKERAAIRSELDALGYPATRDAVEKLLLWKECQGVCPYTGRQFSRIDVLEGRADVEHIIPFSMSLDNSFLNKTLCDAEVNRHEKGAKTPWEAFGHQTNRFEEMLARMRLNVETHGMPSEKLRRFQMDQREVKELLGGFDSRMLNDTRYASRLACRYLASLYGGQVEQGIDAHGRRRVQVGSGMVTHHIRNALGMNGLLNDGGVKTREDHRHHAVDAVAVALTSPSLFKAMSQAAADPRSEVRGRCPAIPPPWEGFIQDLNHTLKTVWVSHRVDNRVRGALHDETLYSPPRSPLDGRKLKPSDNLGKAKPVSHIRKLLSGLSASDLKNIVDPAVRHAVEEKLVQLGVSDPKKAFDPKDPATLPHLPSHSGEPVPIRKVRIRKTNTTRRIGSCATERFVEAKAYHHVVVEVKHDPKGVKWVAHPTRLIEAHERAARNEDVFSPPGRESSLEWFALQGGDALVRREKGRIEVWRLECFEATGNSVGVKIIGNRDARPSVKVDRKGRRKTTKRLGDEGFEKVTVSPLGELRRVGSRKGGDA